ncbi:hypothetical protein F5X97DRAFT_282389 [Nemania serpens]|nr:hypothetical protein F5X97DRAFT_282389 [Nemania serpens]
MLSRAIGEQVGGRRKRKARKTVILREGDEESPLPAPFRTDSLGSRDDEDSREALVWLDTPGADDIFQDTVTEGAEWPSFAPPIGDERRTRKLKPMTPAEWAHAFRNSPMLLDLFNRFGVPRPEATPVAMQEATQEATQETEKSMATEFDDFASISSISTPSFDFEAEFGDDYDRMEGTGSDLELMWSPPYPSQGVPDGAALIDSAARNRWRQTMIERMKNNERPQKWPKRSEFPSRPQSVQEWLSSFHDLIKAACEKTEVPRKGREPEASVNHDSQPLTATVSGSEMQTAVVTKNPSTATIPEVAMEHAGAISGASTLVDANGHNQGPEVIGNAESMENSGGSAIQDHGEPDEVIATAPRASDNPEDHLETNGVMAGSITATTSRTSDNPEYYLVPGAPVDNLEEQLPAYQLVPEAVDNPEENLVPDAVSNAEDNSSDEPQAEEQPAMVHGPVDGPRPRTGWR